MERNTKRILAIVVVAVIVVGGIAGVLIYLAFLPRVEAYYVTPGAPANVNPNYIIKIGVIGDKGQPVGDGAWEGSYLAAKEINAAGGIVINNSQSATTPNGTYYIGLTMEDSDEQNPTLVLSRATQAADRLIYTKQAQFIIGGSRTEAVLAYTEAFMAAKKMFIGTGASEDQLTENVGNNYNKYKYFFRMMPTNSSSLGLQLLYGIGTYIKYLNATYAGYYGGQNVTRVGILYEDLLWTQSLVAAIQAYIPAISGGVIAESRAFQVGQSATEMAAHINAFTAADCDVVIPVISGADSILLAKQYAAKTPDFMLIGIDVASQDSDFWGNTGGDCQYEIVSQTTTRTNKTIYTIAFWDAFEAQWGEDPIYTACGSYDAVRMYADAINTTQSTSASLMIPYMETITRMNPIVGTTGTLGFTTEHDLYAGWPYGVTLWAQWQAAGAKVCLPVYSPPGTPAYYPSTLATGSLKVPPWVNATWVLTPTH